MATKTPSKQQVATALGFSSVIADFENQRMDETSTSDERNFWEYLGVNLTPEDVIERPTADTLSFRGWLEEVGEGYLDLALEWLERERVHPALNRLERKCLALAIEHRREGDETIAELLADELGLAPEKIIQVIQRAVSKFYIGAREVVFNQITV